MPSALVLEWTRSLSVLSGSETIIVGLCGSVPRRRCVYLMCTQEGMSCDMFGSGYGDGMVSSDATTV